MEKWSPYRPRDARRLYSPCDRSENGSHAHPPVPFRSASSRGTYHPDCSACVAADRPSPSSPYAPLRWNDRCNGSWSAICSSCSTSSSWPRNTRSAPGRQGRIDTLGLDRYGAPVVIEYKRRRSGNLISQGLFYLDWLDEHRGEFRLLVHERSGPGAAAAIRWGETRLICVAAAFHRYDLRAVRQIKRRIELLRYHWFGDDLLFLAPVDLSAR